MPAAEISFLDGTKVPWLAFGSYGQSDSFAESTGPIALKAGFNHIDTAQLYGDGKVEPEVGQLLEAFGEPKLYLTSKISRKNKDSEALQLNEIRSAIEASIKKLGRKPDLWLIHSPYVPVDASGKSENLVACWKVLEDLKDEGLLTSIGVSNFQPVDLEAILKVCRYKPVCNQCEFHPYVLEHLEPVLELQKKHGIRMAAYGPLTPIARGVEGPLNPLLTQLAERLSTSQPHPASAATVLLKWQKALGNLAICMSTREERILDLARTDDFRDLTPEEVDEVSRVGKTAYFRYYDTLMVKDFPVSDAIQAKALKGGAFKLKV